MSVPTLEKTDYQTGGQLTSRIHGMPAQFGGAFGFVEAPFRQVVDEFLTWHTNLGFGPRRMDLNGGLEATSPHAYCRAVGIEPFELDLYTGPSALIERTKHPVNAG